MSCGAWKFVDSMKLHGCIYVKCKGCGSDLCPHWDACPRCVKTALSEAVELLGRDAPEGGATEAFILKAKALFNR